MEKSLEKIKQELERKRKHNNELLQSLKQKSIIFNAEKEKQKKYFSNKTSTFLNKKRKPSNSIINIDNNNNINSSYDMINSFNDDYDEYYEDFMNNSIISNRTFNNLNFCRPERFFLKKTKKDYKLYKRNVQELTIEKENKFMPEKTKLENNNNFSFQSSVKTINIINNNDNSKIQSGLGIFSENKNEIKNQDKDKEISYFDGNNKPENDDKNINEINNNEGLFGTKLPFAINEKSLFSSNMPLNNNNDNKKEKIELKNKEKNEEKKEPTNLFGNNIDKINNTENKNMTLFGTPSKPNAEKEKEGENTPETPKKEEKKEKTFTPKLESKPEEKKENKQDDNKENKESIKLFDETPTPNPLFDIKEKKEKIKLPTLTIKEEDNEQITEEKEKENKENNNKPLFGNLLSKPENNIDKDKTQDVKKDNTGSLFSGTSLFVDKKEDNKTLFGNNKDNNNTNISLFGNLSQTNNNKDQKETLSFGLFNNNNPNLNNNNDNKTPSLFGNNNKEEINVKTNEEPKSTIPSNATGSLVTKSNPFLNATPSKTIPNVFSATSLFNNNEKPNNDNNLFKVGNNNNNGQSLFNNNEQKPSLFNNQGMSIGGMDMSPKLGPRNLFNNTPNGNGGSLFSSSNNTGKLNIFGAPVNNTNSLFNNNNINSFQPNSGSLFGSTPGFPGIFSGGFTMGKK